jgi:transcription antitermination factor NusG
MQSELNISDVNLQRPHDGTNLPAECLEPRWYAAYTSANHEKRVALQLGQRSVEHFLPVYDSARRWKDRRVILQMPLFPGYVFVQLALRDRLRVLQVPGVARLVGFNGTPVALPDLEIDAIKAALAAGVHAKPHPYLAIGKLVRVTRGPLAGLQGILLRKKNSTRVVLSLDLIMRSVEVEVDPADLRPIN